MAQAADWPLPTLRAPRLSSCWRQVSCSRSETASRSRKAAGFPPPDRLEPEALPAPFGDWQRLEKRRSPDLHAARGATAPGRIEGMCKAGQHLAAGAGPCRRHAGGNPMPDMRVDNSDELNMIRHPHADPLQAAMIDLAREYLAQTTAPRLPEAHGRARLVRTLQHKQGAGLCAGKPGLPAAIMGAPAGPSDAGCLGGISVAQAGRR